MCYGNHGKNYEKWNVDDRKIVANDRFISESDSKSTFAKAVIIIQIFIAIFVRQCWKLN